MIGPLRRDEGLTTAELVVAMAIGLVLGAMTLALILGLNKVSTTSINRSETSTTARVALESWRDLLAVRESPAGDEAKEPSIEELTSDGLTFYASIDNRGESGDVAPPTRIRISSVDRKLVEDRFVADPETGDYPSDPTVHRVLSTHAELTVKAYTAQGRELTPSAEGPSAGQLPAIARIELSVTVWDDQGGSYRFGSGS